MHALFHMYICYNYYVIQRRRLHKLVKLVSDPFRLYEQITLYYYKLKLFWEFNEQNIFTEDDVSFIYLNLYNSLPSKISDNLINVIQVWIFSVHLRKHIHHINVKYENWVVFLIPNMFTNSTDFCDIHTIQSWVSIVFILSHNNK